jgi:hypothetical protein
MAFQNRVEGDISIYNDLIDLSANCHCPHRVLPVFKSLEGRGIRPDFARSKTLVFLLRYLCTHTHTHIHTHTHTHTHTQALMHTHTHAHAHTHSLTHSHSFSVCLSLACFCSHETYVKRDLLQCQKRPTTCFCSHDGTEALVHLNLIGTHIGTHVLQLLTYFNC